MLRRIKGMTLRDRERSDRITSDLGMEKITLKVRQARLGWHGHVLWTEEGNKMKREVPG